ncbi:MAG: hypothetical protein QOJ29_1006 [Thermoleophilaceae bacterium]|nr:hypothetical protein [Thermoleophilaceae bacterium]
MARVLGILWLATFVTSIVAVLLYRPMLHGHGYITSGGHDTRIALGALLELLLIIANIGTAVLPYSIFKRQSERLALGYVAARIMECVFIAIGLLSLMAVVTLRQDIGGPGSDPASLDTVGRALVAVRDWTFALGPGFVVGIGNGLILGIIMYRSRLLPRPMVWLGLIGGPLIILSGAAVLLDIIDLGSVAQGVATAPEFLWELSIGLYLTFKGFKPAPILDKRIKPSIS